MIKCRYCVEGKNLCLNYDYSNTDFCVRLGEENSLDIEIEGEYSDYVSFTINYCPACGRKLEEVE